jgi:hypothetical protein
LTAPPTPVKKSDERMDKRREQRREAGEEEEVIERQLGTETRLGKVRRKR